MDYICSKESIEVLKDFIRVICDEYRGERMQYGVDLKSYLDMIDVVCINNTHRYEFKDYIDALTNMLSIDVESNFKDSKGIVNPEFDKLDYFFKNRYNDEMIKDRKQYIWFYYLKDDNELIDIKKFGLDTGKKKVLLHCNPYYDGRLFVGRVPVMMDYVDIKDVTYPADKFGKAIELNIALTLVDLSNYVEMYGKPLFKEEDNTEDSSK